MALIRVTSTGGKLGNISLVTTRIMREIGEGLLTRMRKRTEKGVNFKGRAFKPLSPLYAAQKRKELGHSKADLTVSGRMLNDMTVTPSPRKVTLSFLSAGSTKASGSTFIQRSRSISAADKAFWHKVSGAGRKRVKREFFDVPDGDIDWARKTLDTHIGREIAQ